MSDSLGELLNRAGEVMSPLFGGAARRRMARDVASGMAYLHSKVPSLTRSLTQTLPAPRRIAARLVPERGACLIW